MIKDIKYLKNFNVLENKNEVIMNVVFSEDILKEEINQNGHIVVIKKLELMMKSSYEQIVNLAQL